jgi:ABC-type polysaccharide/polyol phosphate transport system ATPase subunit
MTAAGDVAARLEGVGKRYTKLDEQAMLLRSILPIWRPSRTDLWALRDIDLTIGRGESVGILGANGAGKTTMLRLLAGVTRPTRGRVRVAGRVAPLISVGVGFHSEMSGRENVHVNGMLLGLSRQEIEERFDEIVAFAELEEFIDTPVKFYSSGMFLRLGFSVAIHVEPDVLLLDEILAVGDLAFQLKCYERMREIQRRGTTIVLVSHSVHAVRQLCSRAVLLRQGRLEFDGGTGAAIAQHYRQLPTRSERSPGEGALPAAPPVRIVDRHLVGPNGPTSHLSPDESATYRATLRFELPVENPQLIFRVMTQEDALIYETRTLAGEWERFDAGDTAEVEVSFHSTLGGDAYRLILIVTDVTGSRHLFEDYEGLVVYVAPRPGTIGVADVKASIAVDGRALSAYPDVFFGPKKVV